MTKNDSMKFLIFNFWWSSNYGAMLTAYSLKLILNYYTQNIKLVENKTFTEFLINLPSKFVKNFSNSYFQILKNLNFYSDYLSLYNKSVFITGSDQVFRPIYYPNKLEQYLLDFAKPEAKKIAFSASFGVCKEQFLKENSKEIIEHMKKSLQSFDFISVREKSGVEICKEVLGIDAEWIIDPVFILDKVKYDDLINSSTKNYSDKIVSYVLDDNKTYNKAYKYLEKKYGTKVIKLADSNESVENWLSAIQNSKLFITDSFHGVCFAIIFNKPFICISNKSRGAARFESILEMLGIENQCINSVDEIYTKDCVFKIDYEKVNKRIEEERQRGLEFLQKALNAPVGKYEEKQAVRTKYLEDTICELEKQANLKYQIKKELWNLWLIIFHKYLPEPVKDIIRALRGNRG